MEILEFTSKEAAAPLMSLAAPVWFWKFWEKNSEFGNFFPKFWNFINFQNFELKFPKSEANFDAERGILFWNNIFFRSKSDHYIALSVRQFQTWLMWLWYAKIPIEKLLMLLQLSMLLLTRNILLTDEKVFLYFQSNKERDMRQLITLPMGELIPAKPALPVNVAQAQTIGCFRWDSWRLGMRFRNRKGYQNNKTLGRLCQNQ